MSTFYESIARYYDRIFPVTQAQLDLLFDLASPESSRILDAACATGGYARELFLQGHEVVAIDQSPSMVQIARENTPGLDARVIPMEALDCIEGGFDVIYCIGNALADLEDAEAIEKFIHDAYDLLHTDGTLLVHVVNYDRILSQEVQVLPKIEEDGLVFERYYHLGEKGLDYRTILTTEDGRLENHHPLYPVLTEELIEAFEKAGFIGIQIFENFYGDSFDYNTSMFLIVLATK